MLLDATENGDAMRKRFLMPACMALALTVAVPGAAQVPTGFEYMGSRKFACRLDAAHTEVIYIDFDFGPDKSVTGKLGVAAWVGDTPYTQVYDVTGRTDRFGENTFKVYIENYKQVSSDTPPGGSAWASRDLDEFTLYNIETNKFTGRHTTVTSASTHNRSERLTYDSNCSEHVVKK